MTDEPGAGHGEGVASAGRQAVSEMLGDRYEVVRKLGAGAFGEVYEARDTTLDRRVAVKRIRLDSFAEGPELEEVKRRFLQEAQVAARLRHPNIVTIHDIGAKGASSFMVMELVQGQTLQALLRDRGRLGLEETVRILGQAAAGLDFAHASGIVHRDVKPANLMIEPSGHVKVMDFGIAKAPAEGGNITRTGTILGTPNYMAPEQARGSAVDGRADLFSLGCTLYECLSGQRPFVGESVTAILLKILQEEPPALDFDSLLLPAPLGDVLRKALAKHPEERYASGKQLMDAVTAAAAGSRPEPAAVATVVSPRTQLPKPVAPPAPVAAARPRRSAARTLGIAAALVLVLGGVVWGASAGLRGAAGAPSRVRVSANVAREEPAFLGRLLGAKPRLYVTVPPGTPLRLRLETALSSETARPDQEVVATTSAPVVVDGHEALPADSRVLGHVSHAAGAGKVSGRGELTLEFDRVATPAGELALEAQPLQRIARATVKKDAGKVAAGAGIGALVGGILGGKKGAIVGGAVGGSAGAGAVLATKGEEVVLPAGSALETRLRSPLTVTLVPAE
jgi:serine/threonine-protein kinase